MRLRPAFRLLALIALVLSVARPASAQFGIAAGLNFDSIEDLHVDSGNVRATFDGASGYHAGVFYDLGAGSIALRIGAFYRDMGTVPVVIVVGGTETSYDVNLSMIEIPLELRLTLLPMPTVRPFILGGGSFGIPRSEDKEFDTSLAQTTASAVIGGGVALELGTIALIPEFRYVLGISGLLGDEFTIGDTTILVDKTLKANSVQLRLGLRF